MKDRMRDKILVVVAVLLIGCSVILFLSSQTTGKFQQELELERYKRITAEENISKLNVKIATLQSELSGLKTKIQSVQAALQGQSQSTDLKAEFEDISKAKGNLELKVEELKSKSDVSNSAVLDTTVPQPEVAAAPSTPGQTQ